MGKDIFALMDEMFKVAPMGARSQERRDMILRRMMELDAEYPKANWGVEDDKLRMAWAAQDQRAGENVSLHERLGRPEGRKIRVEIG